jgi:prepilin-type N-terminal cleavage/methylation domain-containing protein
MHLSSTRGFTLVEMLTSAAILAIAVVALVAVVRTGRELEVTDLHRRRARALVDSVLEDPVYHYTNPNVMPPIDSVPGVPVVIDPRDLDDDHDDLIGTLWVHIIDEQSTPIQHKQVIAAVRWREPEGMDTIVMEKRVARLH